MNTNKHIPDAIKELEDSELREAILSLKNVTWEEDAILRTLAIDIYGEGEDNVMHMIALAIPLAMELETRIRTTELRLSFDQKQKLAEIYNRDIDTKSTIAIVCDIALDPSGGLLGEIRNIARNEDKAVKKS